MKKFIFLLLIALSFSAAIAQTPKSDEAGKTINIFKAQPVSSIFTKAGGSRQCIMACYDEWRRCLNQNPQYPYWQCELPFEHCSTACVQ